MILIKPSNLKMDFRLIYVMFICLFIMSCGSSPETTISQSKMNLPNQIYAKLEKQDDSYSFTQFQLNRPSSKNEAWVYLNERFPLWDYKRITTCARDRFLLASNTCNTEPHLFMEFDESPFGAAIGLVYSAGIVTAGATKFDEDAFSDAFSEALSKIQYDGSSGLNSLMKTPNFSAIVKSYTDIKTKLNSSYETAKLYGFELDGQDQLYNKKLTSFTSYTEMTNYYSVLAEKTNYLLKNKDEIQREARESFVIKLNEEFESEYIGLRNIYLKRNFYNKYIKYEDKLNNQSKLRKVEKFIIDYDETQSNLAKKRERARQEKEYENKQRFIAQITSYRESLKEGQDSHCGLVIEVKKVVVSVQTMIGLIYIKRNQLYPPRMAECKFVNNVYSPPYGLAI